MILNSKSAVVGKLPKRRHVCLNLYPCGSVGFRPPQLVIDASRPFSMKKEADQLVIDASGPFSMKKERDSWTTNQTFRGTHVSLLMSLSKHATSPY